MSHAPPLWSPVAEALGVRVGHDRGLLMSLVAWQQAIECVSVTVCDTT
jgi:hypothetical protein